MTKVVNLRKEDYDVYIGRGKCPKTGRPSPWGNPYTHIADKDTLAEFVVSSREEAIEKYREYLLNNEELMAKLDELDGKVLGCWCHPKSCHGDVIIEVLSQRKLRDYFKKG